MIIISSKLPMEMGKLNYGERDKFSATSKEEGKKEIKKTESKNEGKGEVSN
jgi:hypothetical protein